MVSTELVVPAASWSSMWLEASAGSSSPAARVCVTAWRNPSLESLGKEMERTGQEVLPRRRGRAASRSSLPVGLELSPNPTRAFPLSPEPGLSGTVGPPPCRQPQSASGDSNGGTCVRGLPLASPGIQHLLGHLTASLPSSPAQTHPCPCKPRGWQHTTLSAASVRALSAVKVSMTNEGVHFAALIISSVISVCLCVCANWVLGCFP